VKPALIAVVFAAGALAARATLSTAGAFPVDLAQPIPVATNWGGTGLLAWIVLALTLILAGGVYLQVLRAPKAPTLAATLASAALAMAAGFVWLPLFSSDVYAYAAYGEMARLGLDPYVHHALLRDPIVADARWQWSGTLPICVYGAAFVAIARAAVSVAHGLGVTAILETLRLVAVLSLLAAAPLAAAIPDDAERGRRAAFFIVCNPLVLWAAIEGHNDTLMLAAVLGGITLMRRFPAAGAATVALGATIKFPALVAAFGAVAHRIAERRNAFSALAGALAGAAIVAASSGPLLHGVRTTLAPHAVYHPMASVQALGPVVSILAGIAVLWRVRTFGSTIDRWCTVALALWIAIPNPYPWYALWIVPLAAFARDARVTGATLLVAAAALLRYLPDAVGLPGTATGISLGLLALAAYVPLFLGKGLTRSAGACAIISRP
jgi:hypothetical protein